ncbi:hypothetical protein [Nocardiopsis gilva]|nr:hypothetical protein [Nocardiopsis gilva]
MTGGATPAAQQLGAVQRGEGGRAAARVRSDPANPTTEDLVLPLGEPPGDDGGLAGRVMSAVARGDQGEYLWAAVWVPSPTSVSLAWAATALS